MITFKYTARNPKTGEKIKSEVQADNIKNASLLIQKLGYAPLDIVESNTAQNTSGNFLKKIRAKDKVIFARQLSTLINAGLPIVQSLRTVQDQTKNKYLQSAVAGVITDVESGKPLSEALARHPMIFNNVFINLVAAGEASGTLDKSLDRLATQMEKDAEIMSKVYGAMIYPIIVLFVMFGVVLFMLVRVLPEVEKLYATSKNAKLPFITQALLSTSDVVVKYWWVNLVVAIVAIVFIRRWSKTLSGRNKLDGLKIRLPIIKKLMMRLYMARFTRTAHTLVCSGVPLLQVLEVTSRSVNNTVVEESIRAVAEKVKGGKALSEALATNPNFLDLVPKMIKIGEQSGALESMLDRTAIYFEKEVDNQVKTISTVVEPAMMIILGVIAMALVAAVLLPIYSLAGQATDVL